MSSKSGPRAAGTDGTDFRHRQKISEGIKQSVQYKFYLKILFCFHFLVLLAMWAKVGGDFVVKDLELFKNKPKIWYRLDLPSAYPWEYVWCLSFIPIVCALYSFPKNRIKPLKYHYYGQFFFGIMPCCIGIGGQLQELILFIRFGESSNTPTFAGHFPMVILWYLFFLVALQIHGFAIYLSYNLHQLWHRPTTATANNINETSSDQTSNTRLKKFE